ncbi:MAG TPA: DUF2182 domain-containing protein [Candidatus Dormibacteraeota bacterium]|nr:DUF2182 domain-containing protein [Candidatus Dormibacteraeota bacterium]
MAALAAAAWLVIIVFAVGGGGAVVRHDRLITGGLPLWQATLVFVAGWQVMLAAMMLPPSLPAIRRRRDETGGAARFVAGYLLVWNAFGLAAFFFDVGVHATVDHSPWLAMHPWLIAGTTLVVAGSYQLSGVKSAFVTAARSVNSAPAGLMTGGLAYGLRCLGANWALMLLAFAIGAGSIALMAALTAGMIWEATPWGRDTVKPLGYALIAVGVLVLAGPTQGVALWSSR